VDLNWIFDELGLDEIKVPAPPPRPRPEIPEEDYYDPEDYDDDDEYDDVIDDLVVEQYIEKIHQFLNGLTDRNEGSVRMKASGCNFMEVLQSELDEEISPKVRGLLDFFVPAIWFALDLEGKFLQANPDTLNDEFDVLALELEDMANVDTPARPESLLELCMNEELFIATSNLLEVYQQETTVTDKLSNSEISDLIFHLIAVSNVLTSYKLDL
jgi:hypothetical protein